MNDIILNPPSDAGLAVPPAICPFTVVVDTREQIPFSFLDFRTDARDKSRPLVIPTTRHKLHSGDYSIAGLESCVSIERKSLTDLFGTIGRGRRRFERLLGRLNALTVAEVVVEATWPDVLTAPPMRTKLRPKTVFRSVLAWKQRFRNVHWTFAGSRRLTEVMTFRMLERFWRDNHGR